MPPHIFDEHPPFLIGCRAPFIVEFADEFDDRKIVAALLFERTVAQRIVRADAIVAGI
jgi:hypothetical protein